MVQRCDRCPGHPVIFLRYSGQHLCDDHFIELLTRRFKKELRAHRAFGRRGTIGIAVSGGKDSTLCLALMHRVCSKIEGVELRALTIDEGIADYRPSSVEISRKLCSELDIELDMATFKELYGTDLDRMVSHQGVHPCTICGILRRRAMNSWARELGCHLILTGHNLDDMAQTVLMNVMSSDLERLLRLGPHLNPIPGFVPRAMPLRSTPETETHLASLLLGLPIHDRECPYSVTAKRGLFRDLVLKAEDQIPGTRHMLLRFRDQLLERIGEGNPRSIQCPKCKESMVGQEDGALCKACLVLEGLKGP